MKQIFAKNPKEEIEKIASTYIAFHHNTGQTDIEIAKGYFIDNKSIITLAEEFSYHEGTIYQKLGEIKAFIQGFDDYSYVYVPKDFRLAASSNRTYILACMTFAAYQNRNEKRIRRIEISARYPALKNSRDMLREIESLKNTSASCRVCGINFFDAVRRDNDSEYDSIPVYDYVTYRKGFLQYEFTDRILWLLSLGQNIRDAEKESGGSER